MLQLSFFVLNGLGLFFGIVYNVNTPDLYENNSHHTMGWVFTWFSLAWIFLATLNSYTRAPSGHLQFAQNSGLYERLPEAEEATLETRWSGDTTGRLERRDSAVPESNTPTSERTAVNFNDDLSPYSKASTPESDARPGLLGSARLDRFLSKQLQLLGTGISGLLLRTLHGLLERTLVIQGFTVLLAGIVTYGGIFVSGVLMFLLSMRLPNSQLSADRSCSRGWPTLSKEASSFGSASSPSADGPVPLPTLGGPGTSSRPRIP